MKQTCILILGMHRSGTSALTGVLNLLDVYLGEELLEANFANEKGYFENNNLFKINEDILEEISSSWDDIFYDVEKLKQTKNYERLLTTLKDEFQEKDLFAIKDPRIVFLFPLYEKAFQELQIDLKIILPYRNPLEVAYSLNKRDAISIEKGLLLWAYHFLLAEQYSRQYNRVLVEFDELIRNPKRTFEKVSQCLEFDFNKKFEEKEDFIKDFLEPSLKHNQVSVDKFSENFPIIIDKILQLKDSFNQDKAIEEFDKVRQELFSSQHLFYNQEIKNIIKDNETLTEKILSLQNEIIEKNEWAFDLEKQIKSLEKAIDAYKQHNSALESCLLEKEKSYQEKEKIVCSLNEEILKYNEIIEEQRVELENIRQTVFNSRGWKLLKKYYAFKEILKIALQGFRHPVKLLNIIDRTYWNKLLKHLKEGNYAYILERLKYYVNTKSPNLEINLMQIEKIEDILDFPFFEKPKVTIIIPVYNQFYYTYNCLKSILEFTNGIEYEIIIADDVSTDETVDIEQFCKNITIIRNEKNLGFLLNCKNAADRARGKYIVFLNNDTNVQRHWLKELIQTIENDATIGMVGSKLVYADGRLQEAGGIIWNDASGWNYGRLDDPNKAEYNYVKEVDYISGAALMIRTSLWKEIGGFDERYVPAYYEDTDLAFAVRHHGYKVILQPKSVVVHFEGISNGTDTGSGIKKYQLLNHEKFYEKWKKVLVREHFSNAKNVFLARDRSQQKPHVLFVDHYLPHYDQDAGSKATLQYLEILVNEGMQVHFIGDNFWHYPDTPYLETLTNMGIEVLYGPWYSEHWKEWFRENGHYFNYVILARPHISIKYIDFIKENTAAKIIYFGHDLHFLREEREYKIKQDETYLKNSLYWKKLELKLIEKANASFYFSDVEKSVLQEENNHLNVDVVPLYIYNKFEDIEYRAEERKDIVFVGGFGHGANIDAVLWFVKDIFPLILEVIPDIHFYIIGSKPTAEILALENEHISVTGFVSDEVLKNYLRQCKLIVAPLRYGAGVKGKIIDAMYNSLPIVTTSIGAEGIQEAEKFMEIADKGEEFVQKVISLYRDNDRLEKISKDSLEYCKKYFSVEFAKKQMQNIIEEFK